MSARFNYFLTYFCFIFCLRTIQSDLQTSKEDVEYTTTSIVNRQRAIRFNSQPYLKLDIESRTKCLTNLRQQPQLSASDTPNSVTYIKKAVGGTENHQTQPHLEQNKNDFQKVDATKFSTLSKKYEIKPNDKKQEMQKPQKQQQLQQQQYDADVEAKPIIENGVNQPHNQQHLTVNQAEMKQQLSPHYSKLLNVVNHRIKRQTPAVNSNDNNNNNNDNHQQYKTFSINYYSFKEPEQQQQQASVVQYQLQQKPQQYQLQNYQPNQSQNKKTYNNIELIASGNSFLTIPQSSTILTDRQQQPQQQQQSMIISISQPKAVPLALSFLAASQTLSIPLFSTPFPSSPLAATATGFKPLLPQEIVLDLNEGPSTPPSLLVCKACCVPNELPCSQCCDGNPLLNAKTLKTLGG